MELLALLSNRDEIIPEVKEALKKYTVYPLKTIEELEDLYGNIPLSLFIIDTVSHKLSSLGELLSKLDDDMVVLIASEKPDKFTMEQFPPSVYDCIDAESIRTELPIIVERALERQRFKNELTLLKKSRSSVPPHTPIHSKSDVESGKYLREEILVNFAKMLTASFDMRKLFSHFMDSVKGITHVNKMSVMLRDKEGFYVKAHYGLDPYIADNLKLKKDGALVIWLTRTGRIMHKPVELTDTVSINIKSEMELLQCSYSFPMMHKGKLIGVFNIGNKITEEPFYKEELEIIYMFCNYLAAAIKDIDLYHQMWYQKEFTKNILSSMNSGLIAIDRDEKITIFNQQASEILNQEPSRMVGSDLRSLPSPLGDILYETMVMGTSYKRHEVEVGPTKTPIGINSYRLMDENKNPVGAGIVFTDLSDSKKLEEQKRKTERLETINDLMAKIAHEVRTPLTSIQTYTQILSEKYSGDEELQNFFASIVVQSIHELDGLIDKLVIFSSKSDYNFTKEDINLVIDEAANYISRNLPKGYKFSKHGITGNPVFINVDRKLLIKAIYYLVFGIVDRTQVDTTQFREGTLITMNVRAVMQNPPYAEISVRYEGEEMTEEERQNLLKPLLDVSNLGRKLNIPISHKIIEGHGGNLDVKREEGTNIFIIKLPLMDRRGTATTVEDVRMIE
jgi:nitrogen-specific signal transduction histidine kinase